MDGVHQKPSSSTNSTAPSSQSGSQSNTQTHEYGLQSHHRYHADRYDHHAAILSIIVSGLTIIGTTAVIVRLVRSLWAQRQPGGRKRIRRRLKRIVGAWRSESGGDQSVAEKTGAESNLGDDEQGQAVGDVQNERDRKHEMGGAKRLRTILVIGLLFADSWVA